MGQLFEGLVNRSVPSYKLGRGEVVEVYTRMGTFRARGSVRNVLVDSLHIKTESGSDIVCTDELYMFVPVDEILDRPDPETLPSPFDSPALDEAPEVGDDPGKSIGLNQQPDASELPQDIKNQVLGVKDLSDDQVNEVMRAIGDAALKALRRVQVEDSDIYGIVDRMQKAVRRELTKQKPDKPKKADG